MAADVCDHRGDRFVLQRVCAGGESFEKVPALHALAPTQTEAPFAVAQLLVLAAFVVAGVMAVKRFKPDAISRVAKLAA